MGRICLKRFDIIKIYASKKAEIEKRLKEFKTNKDIFAELVFCILTPQSKAKLCWDAVLRLKKKNLLFKGTEQQVLNEIKNIRFKNKKARYICLARKYVQGEALHILHSRDWLVENIKGIGYKEASHLLRNIGKGDDLAILDRHVLKNLKYFRVIKDIPNSLSRKKYIEIEEKMKKFAGKINIPVSHLDLVLWCKETGEIFK